MSIAHLRREYTQAGLRRSDLHTDPIAQFKQWLQQAIDANLNEPNAMTLATADKQGRPSARIVLLKVVDERGFVFFTNYASHKGRELEENPQAALVFLWDELERQVRICGNVSKVSREESEAYFRQRPRGSRLGAWVSEQSSIVRDREILEAGLKTLEQRYPGEDIPLPSYWGGYLVAPTEIEFWQGRPNRLHDRLRYLRISQGKWKIERLAP
jgi:pyridoxamine 5'-phosphate oxidase